MCMYILYTVYIYIYIYICIYVYVYIQREREYSIAQRYVYIYIYIYILLEISPTLLHSYALTLLQDQYIYVCRSVRVQEIGGIARQSNLCRRHFTDIQDLYFFAKKYPSRKKMAGCRGCSQKVKVLYLTPLRVKLTFWLHPLHPLPKILIIHIKQKK